MRVAIPLGAFLAGVALGLLQPLYASSVSVVVVFGPTIVGLILMLSLLLAVIFGISSLVPSWRATAVPTFVLSGSLAVGVIGGNWVGGAYDIGLHARYPATPYPIASFTIREFHQAPGTVELTLDDEPAFVVTVADPLQESDEGGLFGHWCYSLPDSEAVGEVTAQEVGELNGRVLSATIRLPEGTAGPRITLQILYGEDGMVPFWAGQGRVADREGSGGRVTFESLPADPVLPGWSRFLTGELSWECMPWPDG
jgi:hypothetical protein